jgi:hypothetical protein
MASWDEADERTTITFGMKVPSGIFIPTMVLSTKGILTFRLLVRLLVDLWDISFNITSSNTQILSSIVLVRRVNHPSNALLPVYTPWSGRLQL